MFSSLYLICISFDTNSAISAVVHATTTRWYSISAIFASFATISKYIFIEINMKRLKYIKRWNNYYCEARDTVHWAWLWIFRFHEVSRLVLPNGTNQSAIPLQQMHRDFWWQYLSIHSHSIATLWWTESSNKSKLRTKNNSKIHDNKINYRQFWAAQHFE